MQNFSPKHALTFIVRRKNDEGNKQKRRGAYKGKSS